MRRIAALVLALACALSGCAARRPATASGFALDTVLTVTVYAGGDEADAQAALRRADECEALLSAHRPDSDVARINGAADGETVAVDALTQSVLTGALDLCAATGGALDVTLYDVSRLWDYKAERPAVPSGAQLQEALRASGWERVEVTQAGVAAHGAALDLGAVAKGAVGDEMRQALRGCGVTSALLDLGGNIFTLGGKPDGAPWVVAIDSPFEGEDFVGTLTLRGDAAVSTSSGAQRYFELDGVRYHHILDPKTGLPARSGLASVTVVAQEGLLADGLSTALFVAGEQEAARILDRFPGVGAVLVREDGTASALGEAEFAPWPG